MDAESGGRRAGGQVGRRAAALAALATALLAATMAQARAPRVPRTSWGAPDLGGEWTNASFTNLERPPRFKTLELSDADAAAYEHMMNDPALAAADREARRKKAGRPAPPDVGQRESEWFADTRLMRVGGRARTSVLIDPPDGQLPYTQEGQARVDATSKRWARAFDDPEDRDGAERCLQEVGQGPPLGNTGYNALYLFVQTRDELAIVSEMEHDVRHIRIGGAHRPAQVRTWMGDSVGIWRGDVLEVETTGFHPLQATLGGADYLISPDARVVERFSRLPSGEILYRFEVKDPKTYTRPWAGVMTLRTSAEPFLEYACHEGNYSLPGILAGARRAEREGRTPEPLDGGDPPPKPASAPSAKPPA